MRNALLPCLLIAIVPGSLTAHARSPEDGVSPRRPGEFAIIFNMGYAADALPQDPEQFEALIGSVKAAHYNTVLCKYEPWREVICRKHGVKMMVDLLAPGHHVYKDPEAAKTLCEKLSGSDAVYGYHLWSDEIGGTVVGRVRDAANVRKWDPNHPTYVGSRNARGLEGVVGADLLGYYDFHWRRGGHFRHLARAWEAARRHDARLLEYCQGDPGLVGKGNYNRVLYTVSTSLAFGLKGYMFHYTGAEIDKSTWEWRPLGEDLARVNAEVAPMGAEVLKLGNPTAVYSTPVSKTEKDDLIGDGSPVPHPELAPVPSDFYLQVISGETLLGVFQDEEKRDAVIFANHNCYQVQKMKLRVEPGVKKLEVLDRRTGEWRGLVLDGGEAAFELPPGAAAVVRVGR